MSGHAAITDVRLTANITWLPGPELEAGSGILLAKGTSSSRIDLTLDGGGKRTEIRNNFRGPHGKWINPDGKSGDYPLHNCWTDAAWFFPALSSLGNVGDPHFVFSYIGEETWNGLSARHLRVYRLRQGMEDAQRLSTMDFYLDPSSLLLLGLTYNTHPDKNMNVNLLSEVLFADYKVVDGVQVPFRIEQLRRGALLMDITVSSVSFNTGVSDASFDTH
jgi:hypothetical protein